MNYHNIKKMKLLKKYNKNLIDLGEKNDKLTGIFSPNYSSDIVKKYIHDTAFTTRVESYVKRYSNDHHQYRHRFEELFKFLKISTPNFTKFTFLDIGTGPGVSTIELLNLFPNSNIVSSDLSLGFLVHIKNYLIENNLDNRCDLLQLNAEELDFEENQFDFIFGVSLLHHLFDPEKTIQNCSKILKKNGHAVFYDPMKSGYELLYNAYKKILDDEKSNNLANEQIEFFKEFIENYELRIIEDKSNPVFKKLDDKWFFEKTFFQRIAEKYGLTCSITEVKSGESLAQKLKKNWNSRYLRPDQPLKFDELDTTLEKMWNERDDLQQVFPEVKNQKFDGIRKWAKEFGWNEDPRLQNFIPKNKTPIYKMDFPDWVWNIIHEFDNLLFDKANGEKLFAARIIFKK